MRVVVISDKRTELESIARALRQASCSVEPFGETKAALAAIAFQSPQVVVLAWPASGGADLVRSVRGADSSGQTYVLAILARTPGGHEIPTVLAAGAHDLLCRPLVDEELVARVKAPTRLMKWAQSVTNPSAFDFSSSTDFTRLRAWQQMGTLVAEDLAQVVGQPLEAIDGWPQRFGSGTRGATILLSLATEQSEVRVSVVADPPTVSWLGKALLGDTNPSDAALDDVLRELANTAGGAVKRAALPENVTLTTGMPFSDSAAELRSKASHSWTVMLDGGRACIAIVGEIRARPNERVPASKLREGMVVVNDLRGENGMLLVTAGSRLTSTTAERVAKLLGGRFLVEVAFAA
jgi:CheY-like chemotaxis protein